MFRERRLIAGAAFIAAACASPERPAAVWLGTVDTIADTVRIVTQSGNVWGRSAPLVVDSVAVVWQSDSLLGPAQMLRRGDDWYAVDGSRILVFREESGLERVIGRRGDGPGEFRRIQGAGWLGDTLLVLSNARLSRFVADTFAGSDLWDAFGTAHAPLWPSAGGVFGVARGLVRPGEPFPSVINWRSFADSSMVVDTVAGPTMISLGDYLGPKTMFGEDAVIATGPDGVVAYGDGLEYCLTVREASSPTVRRICRGWTRAPVGAAVRNPDVDLITEVPGGFMPVEQYRRFIAAAVEAAEVPDQANSYTSAWYDGAGRLWVEVIDSTRAEINPFMLVGVPSLRPAHRHWDVFGPDGRLLGEVLLPWTFMPMAVRGSAVYGTTELETGELAIGRVEVTALE